MMTIKIICRVLFFHLLMIGGQLCEANSEITLDRAASHNACKGDLNPVLISQAEQYLKEQQTHLDSFIVSYCGERITENYYNGFTKADLHEIQSATKTISAALIGIAMELGLIENVEQRLVDLLPGYRHLFTGQKANITLRQVLTMTTGLKWVDFGEENSFVRIARSEDSVAFVLNEPLMSEPGKSFAYNTGSSHLLAAIIHYNSGMTAKAFAQKHLFGVLGIDQLIWPALDDGVNQGGWGMYLRPDDMAKIGQLYLDEGQWRGKTVLGKNFIDVSTAYLVDNGIGGGYGYQMWNETDYGIGDLAGARGYGGQDIFVLEERDMVIVFTGNIGFPKENAQQIKQIIRRFIAPASDITGGIRAGKS